MNRFPVENIDKVNAAKTSDSSTTAEKLLTARDIVITGDLSGSASFNGTSNISINAVIADDSHNHVIKNIDNLQTTLNNINTTVNGKANSNHSHTLSQISDYSTPTLVNRSNYANQLTTARNISLSGDVTGTISFNGTANVTIPATIANTGVTAGTYGPSANDTASHGGKINIPCVTVSAKGQVTSAYNRVITLPAAPTASSIGAATFGLEKLAINNQININIQNTTSVTTYHRNYTFPCNALVTYCTSLGRRSSTGGTVKYSLYVNTTEVDYTIADSGDAGVYVTLPYNILYVSKNTTFQFKSNAANTYGLIPNVITLYYVELS